VNARRHTAAGFLHVEMIDENPFFPCGSGFGRDGRG
jgi:hypothetical protein